MGSLMVSLNADDFIILCSITVKHAHAAIGFFLMMNQCAIIVSMVIDLEKNKHQTWLQACLPVMLIYIHAERIEHDDRHEIK